MKHYYIKYPRGFANEYLLFSVEARSQSEKRLWDLGFTRIARTEAENLCWHERYRRQYDKAMSGYAPATIEPFEGSDYEFYNVILPEELKEELRKERG